MIYNGSVIFPFSKHIELQVYILIDGEAVRVCIPLPFVRQEI